MYISFSPLPLFQEQKLSTCCLSMGVSRVFFVKFGKLSPLSVTSVNIYCELRLNSPVSPLGYILHNKAHFH